MKNKRNVLYRLIQTIFLTAFIIAGFFNVSYAQTKVDKLDKLISTYVEYGQFNGAVLVAEKGTVLYFSGGTYRVRKR